jgi:ABC-type lipoprotein export system ATPase subunit
MTELSGGQARALMIADATIVCETPIVLLDEVENAGIHRTRALELLREHRKIFIFVTHDPRIALLSRYRIVMANGSMTHLLETDESEREVSHYVNQLDDRLARLRDALRVGKRLTPREVEGWA